MTSTRTILVPIDFSQASLAAFETAVRLHADPGSAIVVIHVVDTTAIDFAVELGYGMRADVESKARTHAETTMRRLTDVEIAEGVDVQRVVTVGRPVLEILKLSEELMADLIVIGAHPAVFPPEHSVRGTTAERVLRVARCPVLVIPGPEDGAIVEPPVAEVPSGAPTAT